MFLAMSWSCGLLSSSCRSMLAYIGAYLFQLEQKRRARWGKHKSKEREGEREDEWSAGSCYCRRERGKTGKKREMSRDTEFIHSRITHTYKARTGVTEACKRGKTERERKREGNECVRRSDSLGEGGVWKREREAHARGLEFRTKSSGEMSYVRCLIGAASIIWVKMITNKKWRWAFFFVRSVVGKD